MTRTAALQASVLFVFLTLFVAVAALGSQGGGALVALVTGCLCAFIAFFALATPKHAEFRMQRVVARPERRF